MTILNGSDAARRGHVDYEVDELKPCKDFERYYCMFNPWGCYWCDINKPADSPAISPPFQ